MTASSTTHAPRPFTKEELAKLLETFTVDEVAFIVEQRARKSKDPYQAPPSPSSTLGPSGVAKAQHIFEPLPWWFDEWAGQRFYVPDRLDPYSFTPTTVTGPVVMMFWQKVVTRFLLDINRPYDRFYQNIIISTLKKTGKALALDTPLPTPSGWTTMGDVNVGDYLFGPDGQPTRVIRATRVMEGHDCFAVHFSDGETIIADADHQWAVEHLHNTTYETRTYTTRQLAERDTLLRKDGARLNRIPVAAPLEGAEVDFPVDPYVLGVWLGDGSSKTAEITCYDDEIIEEIRHAGGGENITKRRTKDALYLIGSGGRTQKARNVSLQARLRGLDVLDNKHIPRDYLRSSVRQRLALLQGLMDTDGYISASKGTGGCICEFSVTNERLALDVRELITTLGLKSTYLINPARLYGKDCGLRYRIAFTAPAEFPVFRLPRKLERQRSSTEGQIKVKRSTNRHIIAVDPVPSVPVRCVEVDSPSHLYLCGRSMIPTHNSLLAAAIGRWISETWGNYSEVICLGSDKDQAEDKLYAAITKSIELDPGYDSGLQTLFSLAISPDDPDPYNPTLWIPDYTRPLWRLRSDGAQYIPNHGTIKAVPRVYKKLAGGNQTAAIFTEMWTWNGVDAQRLVDEMTPPPTRPRSIRLMEGYAGFEGESGIWEDFWDKAMNPKLGGRMVTREELEPYGGWPFPPTPQAFKENDYAEWRDHPDPIPLYVNDSLRIGAFIDQGEAARRMPWQTPEYYETQRLDESYDRHHRNVQSAHKEEFVPKHWWDACNVRNHPAYVRRKDRRTGLPLPPVHESLRTIPPLLPNEPAVMAVDGSVDSDCTALMIVSYACTWDYLDAEPNHLDPTVDQRRKRVYDESHVMVRYMRLWEPTKEHPMNHTTMVKPEILRWHGYYQPDPDVDDYEVDPNGQEYNIVEVVYDQYQLHDLMINLRNDYGIWVKVFSQQTGRDMADKDLYDAIRDRKFWHDGDPTLDAHRAGAARRRSKNIGSSTENRTHLVKKNGRSKIDLFVVASMGRFEMARLDA